MAAADTCRCRGCWLDVLYRDVGEYYREHLSAAWRHSQRCRHQHTADDSRLDFATKLVKCLPWQCHRPYHGSVRDRTMAVSETVPWQCHRSYHGSVRNRIHRCQRPYPPLFIHQTRVAFFTHVSIVSTGWRSTVYTICTIMCPFYVS